MPQSLVKILVHIVFSTKNREHLLLPDTEGGLYRYISGIVEGNKSKLIIANGTTDHSHFLVSLGKNDVSELIGDMKRDSSLWAKKNGIPDLYWQRGYGAFSIGQSQVPAVTRYIATRKSIMRHKVTKMSFGSYVRSTTSSLMKNSVGIDCSSLSATRIDERGT
ncbi:MAG: transposase [Blastocatellia bacterium]|nr:transposase [Blastocatellia bacterium]